ncbi:signal peptidase I [Lachnospiraceae bacterium WCA-693-APC-MOT-I]|uniref:Signal peptidase I n=2 Tax=Velocimicrobium porci TaxID=2606634 RepID=A0A6L5XYW6_9FIRM|nr:signal peptidase I [Velocimicrobium porci]
MEQASFVREEKKTSVILSVLKEFFILIICLLLAYGIASLVNEYFVHQTRVEGISMEDTLDNNDYLLINKFIYQLREPKRFDIIVFPYEYNVFYIKRIIGLPGETVQIKNGSIYINGEKLEENYGKEEIDEGGTAAEPITLGQDEYFVLGDNRNHSLDSREPTIGIIPREKIIGKAWMRIFPFQKIQFF